MTIFTQENYKNVELDIIKYIKLENPSFVGQTRVDKDGNYKMYFVSNDTLYGFQKNIFN